MMHMEIKNIKILICSLLLTLLLAPGVQANQESSSIDKEVLTINSDIKIRPSIDPDVKVEFIIVRSIKLIDDRYGNGKVVLDLEIVDYKGNHTFKTCEKTVQSGHDYFYTVIREDATVEGKIKDNK